MRGAHPRRRAATFILGLGCALASLTLLGCRVTLPHDPAASRPAVPPDGNAELMEYIAAQPLVTADAACRVIHLLWRGEAYSGTFDELLAVLQAGEIAPGHWQPAPDECVDRALVGYLVCRAADIRSGFNWWLTGLGRYAWRELQYRRIAGAGSDLRLISGGEFLGVVTRAGEHMAATQQAGDGPVELGSEP